MYKRQLQYFLKSCYLGGEIGSVIWEYKSKSKKLITRIITGDKMLLGFVSCNSLYDFSNNTETKLELDWNKGKDFKIGIYDLDQLKKMISILDDTELKIELDMDKDRAISMVINDGYSSMKYMCSDLSVINKPPRLQKNLIFKLLFLLLQIVRKSFLRGIKYLKQIQTFVFWKIKNQRTKG